MNTFFPLSFGGSFKRKIGVFFPCQIRQYDDDHVFSLKIQSDNNARLHRLLDYNSALE